MGFGVQSNKTRRPKRIINKIYFKVADEDIEVLEYTLKRATKLVKGQEGVIYDTVFVLIANNINALCSFLRRGCGEVLTSSPWKDFLLQGVF